MKRLERAIVRFARAHIAGKGVARKGLAPKKKPKRSGKRVCKRRRRAPCAPPAPPVPPTEVPADLAWVPPGIALHALPPGVVKTVVEVLDPMYRDLVLGASDPLEQSVALSAVHVLWLEVLGQLDLGKSYVYDAFLHECLGRDRTIDAHLRLVDAKIRLGYLLSQLREHRKAREAASSRPAPLTLTAEHAPSALPEPCGPPPGDACASPLMSERIDEVIPPREAPSPTAADVQKP